MEESVKMETTTSKEKYRYYVIVNGGREFKIDFETYNICKVIIQGNSDRIQNLTFKTDDRLDFISEITIKTSSIIAIIKHTPKEELENE